jgi:putative toxin-antitoxin system antitoxin component (TIGR02293 family)
MVSTGKRLHHIEQKPARINKQSVISSNPSALRYQSIKDVSQRFSLTRGDIKHLFGVSQSTQFRYEKQNPVLKFAIADRLERFNRICQQALELFEDEAETQRWLSTPKVALGGQTPLGALSNDAGAKKVEELLYQAEYGMFG